jgi:hypothetical protein
VRKFQQNLATQFSPEKAQPILEVCGDAHRLAALPVRDFMALFVRD